MLRFFFPLITTVFLLVNAQSTTVIEDGVTVVQVITTDALGSPTTQVITTLSPTVSSVISSASASSTAPASPTTATTSATTSAATTTSPITTLATDAGGQQGPVGQPVSTSGTPGAPIPYLYTTVVGGVTTVIQDIFTPTSPATVSASVTGTGTILDYSAWLSQFGAPTTSATSGGSNLRPATAMLLLPFVTMISCWMGMLFA